MGYIPDGYSTITAYLTVSDPVAYLAFLHGAFGATEVDRTEFDDVVVNMEVRLGSSMLMLGRASEANPAKPSVLYLYFEDCDIVFGRASKVAGVADIIMEPADMPYGERHGAITDNDGHQWWIASRIGDT